MLICHGLGLSGGMMRVRARLLLLGMALVLGAGPALAKTLVHCAEAAPDSLNPQYSTSGNSYDIAQQIYEKLVNVKRGTLELEPQLATGWELADEGRSIIFTLRQGVKWHRSKLFTPTRDFNADDVVFSFARQMDKTHPYFTLAGGKIYPAFHNLGLSTNLIAVEKLETYKVRFRLKEPDAGIFYALASHAMSIQSAEYGAGMLKAGTPEKVDLDPIGTGPFQLVRHLLDTEVRMRANKDYWRGVAPLDQLVFVIAPDATVRYAKLKAGECHSMAYPNPADLDRMRQDKDVRLLGVDAMSVGYVAMNMQKKPFDDARVRLAVNLAVDKKSILDQAYMGTAKPAVTPIPPGHWAHDASIRDLPHDPAQARALLAEAGLKDGFETELWTMPVVRPYNPAPRRIAEMIQADLAKVGIKAKIVTYEWGEYVRRVRFGEAPMAQYGWSNDEVDRFWSDLLSCEAAKPGNGNLARWCDPELDRLITAARRTSDQEARKAYYFKAQAIFRQGLPWIPVAHPQVFTAIRPEVVDFRASPSTRLDFYGVDVK